MISLARESFDQNTYNVFYHPDGNISSEGVMRNGKPDVYWKTYHKKGRIKSEGNRVDYEFDALRVRLLMIIPKDKAGILKKIFIYELLLFNQHKIHLFFLQIHFPYPYFHPVTKFVFISVALA